MNLSELTAKVLESLRDEVAATLQAMQSEGPGAETDIKNIIRMITDNISRTHWDQPLLATDSNWRRTCISRVDTYLATAEITERIKMEKGHFNRAHFVSDKKLHRLDELFRRAATMSLLVHAGIPAKELYKK